MNEGAGTALVTVARSIPTPEIMNVDYATSHGTATANDYVAQSGTLTFAVTDAVKTFSVPITSDDIDEFNETFNVTLTDRAADGRSELGDGQAVVTINDDDATPSVSVNDITVVEGNSGTTSANFTLTLSGASEKPISFQAATSNGTALAPADYAARPLETLTFPDDPTPLTETYTVAVVGETLNEADETFNVNLSNSVNCESARPTGRGHDRRRRHADLVGRRRDGQRGRSGHFHRLAQPDERRRTAGQLRHLGRHGHAGTRLHGAHGHADDSSRRDERHVHRADVRRQPRRGRRDVQRHADEPERGEPG